MTALFGFPGEKLAYVKPGDGSSAKKVSPARRANYMRGNPSNYLALLKNLRPGDTLILETGIYGDRAGAPGLPISDLHGEPGKPISICGPESGPRPVIRGQPGYNTIRIGSASYVVICRLELDGRNVPGIDAIKSQRGFSHHITLEDLVIRNYSGYQGDVGISTKAPAWDWRIRNNVIRHVGTGMYLGNSDGAAPFVRGVIECNLITDTIGYNIEIKQQNARPDLPGLPTEPSATLIRHNVFSKAQGGSYGNMARPNLLVGHFPSAGAGAEDTYEIYGNFFYENPTGEPLFQGEGNVALYNNLFFNEKGDAILVQPHKALPRKVLIFQNTVVARGTGIKISGGSNEHRQVVIGNAVFALVPIRAADQQENVSGSFEQAASSLRNPAGPLGELDLFPQPGKLTGPRLRTNLFERFEAWSVDFNGKPRSGTYRGAYEGGDSNPGWLPRLEIMPQRNGAAGRP